MKVLSRVNLIYHVIIGGVFLCSMRVLINLIARRIYWTVDIMYCYYDNTQGLYNFHNNRGKSCHAHLLAIISASILIDRYWFFPVFNLIVLPINILIHYRAIKAYKFMLRLFSILIYWLPKNKNNFYLFRTFKMFLLSDNRIF